MGDKKLLIETWLDPDPDDRITTHDLYCAAMEAVGLIESLEAENAELLKDQQRLEWIVDNSFSYVNTPDGEKWSVDGCEFHSNWRDAIDEAAGLEVSHERS